MNEIDPDTTIWIVVKKGNRHRAHTNRNCMYIKNNEEVRELTRKQHPHAPLCKKCTGKIAQSEKQNHYAATLRAQAGKND